jgi:hypothetical protein
MPTASTRRRKGEVELRPGLSDPDVAFAAHYGIDKVGGDTILVSDFAVDDAAVKPSTISNCTRITGSTTSRINVAIAIVIQRLRRLGKP